MWSHTRWSSIALVASMVSCGEEVVQPDGHQITGPTAQLRVVHTLVDKPALDVVVADRVILQSVAYGVPTSFVAVPAGSQPVGFRSAGTAGTPHTTTLTFVEDDSVTVFTIDSSSIINPWVLTDTGSVVPPDKSKLRVAHFAGSAAAIDIWRRQPDWQEFITVMFPFRYREASPYLQSEPGVWQVLVSTEARQGRVPVLTDTLLLPEPIDIPAGESRTVIVLDREGGGLQIQVIEP